MKPMKYSNPLHKAARAIGTQGRRRAPWLPRIANHHINSGFQTKKEAGAARLSGPGSGQGLLYEELLLGERAAAVAALPRPSELVDSELCGGVLDHGPSNICRDGNGPNAHANELVHLQRVLEARSADLCEAHGTREL